MVSVQMTLDYSFYSVQNVHMETIRSQPPVPQQVPLTVFRARLAHFLNLVSYRGITVFIMRKGKAVARVEPMTEDVEEQILAKNAEKMPGECRGQS